MIQRSQSLENLKQVRYLLRASLTLFYLTVKDRENGMCSSTIHRISSSSWSNCKATAPWGHVTLSVLVSNINEIEISSTVSLPFPANIWTTNAQGKRDDMHKILTFRCVSIDLKDDEKPFECAMWGTSWSQVGLNVFPQWKSVVWHVEHVLCISIFPDEMWSGWRFSQIACILRDNCTCCSRNMFTGTILNTDMDMY